MPTYAWSRLDLSAGLGQVRLEAEDPIRVEGREVAVDDHQSWAVSFRVLLDEEWRTRRAEIVVVDDHGHRDILIESDGEGTWSLNGSLAPELHGCLDVDIAGSHIVGIIYYEIYQPDNWAVIACGLGTESFCL